MEKGLLEKDVISVIVECGKIKWLPTLIQQKKEKYEKDGYSLVEENRTIFHYPGYRYRVILNFTKKK